MSKKKKEEKEPEVTQASPVKGQVSKRKRTRSLMRPLPPDILSETVKDLVNTRGRWDGLKAQKAASDKYKSASNGDDDAIVTYEVD